MPHTTSTSSPTVTSATNAPIFPSSSPLSSLGSTSNPRSNPPTPPMKPATPPPIITLSSTSPTPPPEVDLIPGHMIREISDLSDTDVILELDHIYSTGDWPKSPMVFQNPSASLLCLTVFGSRATISGYKQENTILRIYLPKEVTNFNGGICEVEGEFAGGEYVPIRLSSSGLSNDGLFTAAKDAWALYRDEEGLLEALLVEIPPPPARAAASTNTLGAATPISGVAVSTATTGALTPGAATPVTATPRATTADAAISGAATPGATIPDAAIFGAVTGVTIPDAAAAAAFYGNKEKEDEADKEANSKLIRVTRGDQEGWMKFLVEVNEWEGWIKEGVKREDDALESGQLHVKVQIVLK